MRWVQSVSEPLLVQVDRTLIGTTTRTLISTLTSHTGSKWIQEKSFVASENSSEHITYFKIKGT